MSSDGTIPEWAVIPRSSGLVHESNHVKVAAESLGGSEKYVELAAVKAQYDYEIKIGETRENTLKTITNIDDPAYQWWKR